MKVYAVSRVHDFRDRLALSTDHRDLFHGFVCRSEQRDEILNPGEAPGAPLLLLRSAHWRPDVFKPARLVVCEAVRAKLSWVPHVEFRPVKFVKLFNFPYYPPGDFSFANHPHWKRAAGRNGHADRVSKRLPDVPELHRDFPPYYELIPPGLLGAASAYHDLTRVIVTIPNGISGPEEVMLSEELLRDYPILSWAFTLFSDVVFALISPHLDRNYFHVVEVEL